jgi:hypothetical protein
MCCNGPTRCRGSCRPCPVGTWTTGRGRGRPCHDAIFSPQRWPASPPRHAVGQRNGLVQKPQTRVGRLVRGRVRPTPGNRAPCWTDLIPAKKRLLSVLYKFGPPAGVCPTATAGCGCHPTLTAFAPRRISAPCRSPAGLREWPSQMRIGYRTWLRSEAACPTCAGERSADIGSDAQSAARRSKRAFAVVVRSVKTAPSSWKRV